MYFGGAVRRACSISLGISALLATTCVSVTAIFSLSGGTSQQLLSNFNPAGWDQAANNGIGAGTSISVFSSANPGGGLSIDGAATLTFTFLGTEAGYNDVAFLGATQLFATHTAAYSDATGPFGAAAGALPITFSSIDTGYGATNGVSVNENVLLGILKVSSTLAYIFFEDIAKGGDGDFDDLVMRVDINNPNDGPGPTPLPGTVWLFGTAVAGVSGVNAWRRRRVRAAA